MKYPNFLKQSGTIGLVAPSLGCSEEEDVVNLNGAVSLFNGMGYQIKEGPNCRKNDGIGISSTKEACAEEINTFFTDEEVDVIISCGGGELMCEELPFYDFEKIKAAKPKWYMGYSDNTNLTFTLPTICDIAAIYGNGIKAFGKSEWDGSLDDAISLLKGEQLTFRNYEVWEDKTAFWNGEADGEDLLKPYRQINAGTNPQLPFAGRLLGGCLDCLVNLCGTRFDRVKEFNERYKEDGVIWFLESCDLGPYAIRRAIWQLDNAGWFDNAKGFLVGRPLRYRENDHGLDCKTAILDVLSTKNVPVILDLDFGHLPPRMPIVSGGYASVKAGQNSIEIKVELK